jgi:hypothetical protein
MGRKLASCAQYSNSAPSASSSSSHDRLVLAQPAEQHEIRTARDDADRVDLQHAHPPDRRQHVLLARTAACPPVEPLRPQMQPPRGLRAQPQHGVLHRAGVARG